MEKNEETLSLTFTKIEGKCYCCGKSGHKSPQRRFKNKLKSKWFINNVQLTQKNKEITMKSINDTEETEESSVYSGNSTITSKSNPKTIGWTNLHYTLSNYNQHQSEIMKNLVLLDSDSTNTIFCNQAYVTNIRKAEKPFGIQTNGGTLIVTKQCNILHLGTHWFNENAITNISLADMSKKFRVAMDTQKENALIVHLNGKKIKFSQMPGDVYARKPKDNNDETINHNKQKETQNYLTVQDNYKFLSNRQIKKVQEVKRLQNTLGTPSNADLKTIITMNMIQNDQITHEDINLAEQTFGKSIDTIKGKTIRKNEIFDKTD